MSSNNIVWCMSYQGKWHVFYSGCADNTPTEPDYKDKHYKKFKYRSNALLSAHDVVNKIEREAEQGWGLGVEYGVCEITIENKLVFSQEQTDWIEKMINRVESELITKENRIKERLCILEDKDKPSELQEEGEYILKNGKIVWRHSVKAHFGLVGYIDRPVPKLYKKPVKHKDGCYQFTYCNECLAYPMGLGCPNLSKGPVQLKKEN